MIIIRTTARNLLGISRFPGVRRRHSSPSLALRLAALLSALLPAPLALAQTPQKPAAEQKAATEPAAKPSPFRNIDGQVYGFLKSTTGAWMTVCNQQNKEDCLLIQRVASEERPEVQLSVTIFRYIDAATKKKATVMRTFLPLDANVFLPAGLGLYVDGTDLGRAYFVRCSSFGCFSEAVLDDKVIEQLKGGKQAVFTVFLSREEDGMGIPVDLSGISEGLDGLQ